MSFRSAFREEIQKEAVNNTYWNWLMSKSPEARKHYVLMKHLGASNVEKARKTGWSVHGLKNAPDPIPAMIKKKYLTQEALDDEFTMTYLRENFKLPHTEPLTHSMNLGGQHFPVFPRSNLSDLNKKQRSLVSNFLAAHEGLEAQGMDRIAAINPNYRWIAQHGPSPHFSYYTPQLSKLDDDVLKATSKYDEYLTNKKYVQPEYMAQMRKILPSMSLADIVKPGSYAKVKAGNHVDWGPLLAERMALHTVKDRALLGTTYAPMLKYRNKQEYPALESLLKSIGMPFKQQDQKRWLNAEEFQKAFDERLSAINALSNKQRSFMAGKYIDQMPGVRF